MRFVAILVLAMGCGGGGSTTTEPTKDGGTGIGASGQDMVTANGHDAATGSTVDKAALCTAISAQVSSCEPDFESVCSTIFENAEARGCSKWLPALASFVNDHAQAYACMDVPPFGTQPLIDPSAPEDAQVADACAGAVNRSGCWGLSCSSSTDCQTGWLCDDATGHCFDSSATCTGLPCLSSTDCPTGETCNDAIGVCVRS